MESEVGQSPRDTVSLFVSSKTLSFLTSSLWSLTSAVAGSTALAALEARVWVEVGVHLNSPAIQTKLSIFSGKVQR